MEHAWSLDNSADLVADVWFDGTEAMHEPVAVDRPVQLALDVAGGVETGVGAGLDLDVQCETVREAAEALHRQRFAHQVAAELAELREDQQAWQAYLVEADDTSVSDGIG